MIRLLAPLPALLLLLVAGAARAEARCAIVAPGATQRVAVGTTGRSMLVHMPLGMRPGRAMPLLFALHGSGSTGEAVRLSGLEATSDRHGFLLAAPDGGIPLERGFAWNIPGVPTVAGTVPTAADADDVAFLGAAIDWLAAEGCIDRRRVYATGHSGGGRMSSWLACAAADRFAAIAPVVGLRAGRPLASDQSFPDPATCRPARPVPVLAFAGGKDTTNPVAGGGGGYWQYSMRRAEARWADLNGCRRVLPERILESGVIERGYADCRSGADVIARINPATGHEWAVDTEAMWAFLARHRR